MYETGLVNAKDSTPIPNLINNHNHKSIKNMSPWYLSITRCVYIYIYIYICLSLVLCIHQRLVLCRIVGLHESGVMEKLRLQHFGASKEDVCDPDLQVVSSSLTLADIWPLYSLLALGLVLAGVVFIFEYIFLSREIRKRGGSLQTNGGPVTVLQQNGVEENGVGLWWRTG